MKQAFDFSDLTKSAEIIKKTWSDFRLALAKKEFLYNDTAAALDTTFLKAFNDLFVNVQERLKKLLLEYNDFILLRGTNLKNYEVPDYTRFIPDAKYIKNDNRFSPPGIEWLYLAIGHDKEEALGCSRAECRVTSQTRFGYCLFRIESLYNDSKLVDLTLADDKTVEEINGKLEKAAETYIELRISKYKKTGIIMLTDTEKQNMRLCIEEWALMTYLKLLSEQIFIPLGDVDDKKLIYAPFQCMAQYFITKGYSGIVYKSTVSNKGKNLVLFEKKYASPTGKIVIEEPESLIKQ